MAAETIIIGAVSTVVGGWVAWMRARSQAGASVEIARIGREHADAEIERLRARVAELEAVVDRLRWSLAEYSAAGRVTLTDPAAQTREEPPCDT